MGERVTNQDQNYDFEYIGVHFDALDELFENDKMRYLVSAGSSRSGKTFQISLYLLIYAYYNPKTLIAVCRYEQTTVKRTIWRDYLEAIDVLGLSSEVKINKGDLVITFNNGSVFTFSGLNDPAKIKGFKSTHAHVDEALDCHPEAMDQLEQRCLGNIIYSYNPSLNDHKIVTSTRYLPNAIYLHTTYKDNPFIPQAIIDKLESYDPSNPTNVEAGTADERMWKVYGLGIPCGLEGVIYENFKYIKSPDLIPTIGNVVYGLDFGFGHKMGLVKVTHYDDTFYCQTMLYEDKLTIASEDPTDENTLLYRLRALEIPKTAMIICDSARPEAIQTLRDAGYNAHACKKGAGSVIAGIEVVKSQQVSVVMGDPIQKEQEGYVWATDALGHVLKPIKPRKCDDELMDAIRYAIRAMCRNHTPYQPIVSRGQQILKKRDYGRKQNGRRR